MNESINSSINSSVNDVFTNTIQTYLGSTISDSFLYVATMVTLFMVIFITLTIFTNTRTGVRFFAALSPTLISDAFISFGEYTVKLPFFEHTFTHLVMTLSLIEYFFTFQIMNPIMDIISTFNVEVINPAPFYVFISGMYSFGDSILQILIFTLAFYSILTLIENWFDYQIPYQLVVSAIIGFIPVFIYAYFFSNPFHEFNTSQIYIMTFMNFLKTGGWFNLGIFITLGIISFAIIYFVILMVTQLLLSTFITFSPKGKSLDFSTSFESIALLTTMFYTFLFVMHPDYTWYTIVFVIIVWSGFKRFLDTVVSEANLKNTERRKENMLARRVSENINKLQNPSRINSDINNEDNPITTIVIPLLISIILIVTGFYLM